MNAELMRETIGEIVDEITDGELGVEVDLEDNIAYNAATSTLTIGSDFDSEDESADFMRHLRAAHEFEEDWSIALMTLLHEIGHFYTLDEYYEETSEDILNEENSLRIRFMFDSGSDLMIDQYFDMGSEWVATEWAIDWIRKNPEKAKEMEERLSGCLQSK